MVASGIPKSRDDHAIALTNMALDMNAYIAQKPDGATPLKFRIGMNTGSVLAGVIGQQKFHYDIGGDSMNTARGMESHGEPGKIQITREMYELLGDDFVYSPRGVVDIKGKGEMERGGWKAGTQRRTRTTTRNRRIEHVARSSANDTTSPVSNR